MIDQVLSRLTLCHRIATVGYSYERHLLTVELYPLLVEIDLRLIKFNPANPRKHRGSI